MMDLTPERLTLTRRPDTKEVFIDYEKSDMVLDTIMDAYFNNRYPYHLDRVRLPQDDRHMPEELPRGGKEHAMFLWNVCNYMRGGTKSNDAVRKLSDAYERRPDIFDADLAQHLDSEDIVQVMKSSGLGMHKAVRSQWVENSRRMQERYDGDPRKIFEGLSGLADPYSELMVRVGNDSKGSGFIGFQEKMASMIAYYLMAEGLVDEFNFPIPVDLHVMRVSIANGLVQFLGLEEYPANVYSQELLAELRNLYFDYAKRRNMSPIDLCNAVWLLSESSCNRAVGNRVQEHMIVDEDSGRTYYEFTPEAITWDKTQRARYARTCGQCAVAATCDLSVLGGKVYNRGGMMAIRGERHNPPVLFTGELFHENT